MSTTFEQQADGTFRQVDDPPKLSDMVSVVRCGDCRWMNGVVCRYFDAITRAIDYCSHGTRRKK